MVDGLKSTDNFFGLHFMVTLQLHGLKCYDTQMAMQSTTKNADVSLPQLFQKHLPNASRKNGVIDQGKYRK